MSAGPRSWERLASGAAEANRGVMAAVAGALSCTVGQAYTVVLGLAVFSLLAVLAVPDALQSRRTSALTVSPEAARPPTSRLAPVPNEPTVASPSAVGSVASSPRAVPAPGSRSAAGESSPTDLASQEVRLYFAVGAPGAPAGIAVGPDGTVYVSTGNGAERGGAGPSHVFAHSPDGRLRRDYPITGQPANHTDGLTGLIVVGSDIVVLDAATARVLRISIESGAQETVATLPDLVPCGALMTLPPVVQSPVACEPGDDDHRSLPLGIASDRAGNLFVTDAGQATIWQLAAGGGQPQVFHQSSDYATGRGLAGVDVGPDGGLTFAVTEATDGTGQAFGAVYRLAGATNARTLLAQFDRADQPVGLAVDADRRIHVALRGANAIVTLRSDGQVERRVSNNRGKAVAIDTPFDLATHGRETLVTNKSAANDGSGEVLAIAPVPDAGI